MLKYRRPIPKELRKFVKELYNNECFYCAGKEDLHIHHIDQNPNNNDIENLELVCWLCHYSKHPGNERIIEFHYNRPFKRY